MAGNWGENMLMSEGFMIARLLAHKFVTLYSLSKENWVAFALTAHVEFHQH